MKSLLGQVKEFFRPFPEPGSWAYNLQMWWYDIVIALGKHTVSTNVDEPSEEAGDDGSSGETGWLDDSGYNRRLDSVIGDAVDTGSDTEGTDAVDSDKSDDELQ